MLRLLFGLLSHLILVQLVTVERNMFAYYKVPHHLLSVTENPEHLTLGNYYVLQCPPKLSKEIPKPQEMPTCNVIGRYNDTKSKHIQTKVDYMLKRNKPKINSLKTTLRQLIPDPFSLSFSRTEPKNELFVRYQRSTGTRPLKENSEESIEYSASNEDNMDFNDETTENSLEFGSKENDESVLKYLGVKDAILKLLQQKYHRFNDSDSASTLALNADYRDFQKGNRTNGYQHMYHRDESFTDHIFYDDLQENGNYSNYGKAHEDLD